MKYIERTKVEYLRERYDVLVGWGNSVVEFERKYNPSLYKLDYVINGQGKNVGDIICGCKISSPGVVKEFMGKKVCVIIYPNIEQECLDQIYKILPDADTIIGRLVDVGESYNYSSDIEDLTFVKIITALNISDPVYMDIGVCHPVVRNNTYLLYERGFKRGFLVEPNPVMVNLLKEYRSENVVLDVGACAGKETSLTYVMETLPGLNHFLRDGEIIAGETLQIPVKNINDIFEEHKIFSLDILDIDTEGMDYELLEALNLERYKIKVVCAEKWNESRETLYALMKRKGYIHFMSTKENQIYIRKDEFEKFFP